jgi:hypothetical protein
MSRIHSRLDVRRGAGPGPARSGDVSAQRIEQLLQEQDGVVSRRQVLACGLDDSFIERRLRRKDWARIHRGVYVDHTGEPTWRQRAWAAVLFYSPAALAHESALQLAGLRAPGARETVRDAVSDPRRPVHVAVDQSRRVRRIPGVEVHRVNGLATVTQPSRSPPRLRLEHALLDVASDAEDDASAVAVLADACQTRRTTAARLAGCPRLRVRLPRRGFLLLVLQDVAAGAYSALEQAYLSGVERRHGLPTARRQRVVRSGRTSAHRDVEYRGLGVVVELDGRLGHERQTDRWDDLDRDVDSAIAGDVTVRLGWRQVLEPCRTASRVARLLQARGWKGRLRRCGPHCAAT